MNEIEYRRMRDCEDRHWWHTTLHALVLRFVRDEFQKKGPLKIFDAGCGTGGLLAKLAPFGEASGCDSSPLAIKLCHERGLANITQQDLNELALPPASFDVITSIDVIEHAWIRSEKDMLRRLHAALKPGGLFLLNCTALEFLRSPHDAAVQNARRYSRPELRTLLESAGFPAGKLTYRMFFLFPPIALYRIARRLLPRAAGTGAASDVWMPPAPLNAALRLSGSLENVLLAAASLPFGTSLFAAARAG